MKTSAVRFRWVSLRIQVILEVRKNKVHFTQSLIINDYDPIMIIFSQNFEFRFDPNANLKNSRLSSKLAEFYIDKNYHSFVVRKLLH